MPGRSGCPCGSRVACRRPGLKTSSTAVVGAAADRTVDVVSQPAAAQPGERRAVLDAVTRAVLGEPLAGLDVVAMSDDQLIAELGAAAVANARRLAIVNRLWPEERPAVEHLERLIDHAATTGLAGNASIDAAAAMVGAAATGSDAELVDVALRMRARCPEVDLLAGSAALMYALTCEIAAALALDPVRVEFELRAGPLGT